VPLFGNLAKGRGGETDRSLSENHGRAEGGREGTSFLDLRQRGRTRGLTFLRKKKIGNQSTTWEEKRGSQKHGERGRKKKVSLTQLFIAFRMRKRGDAFYRRRKEGGGYGRLFQHGGEKREFFPHFAGFLLNEKKGKAGMGQLGKEREKKGRKFRC